VIDSHGGEFTRSKVALVNNADKLAWDVETTGLRDHAPATAKSTDEWHYLRDWLCGTRTWVDAVVALPEESVQVTVIV